MNKPYFPDFIWGTNEEGTEVVFETVVRKPYRKKWYDVYVRSKFEITENSEKNSQLSARHVHQSHITRETLTLDKELIQFYNLELSEFQGSEADRIKAIRESLLKSQAEEVEQSKEVKSNE